MNTFNGLEIFKIAMIMEEEGRNFYTNGAKYTTGKIKDFLLAAAGQEFLHKEKFEKIYNELSKKYSEGNEYLFDMEVNAYLNLLLITKFLIRKSNQRMHLRILNQH